MHSFFSRVSTLAAILAAALVVSQASQAADPEPPPPPRAAAPQPLAPARAQVKAQNWPAALVELQRVNASGDADWNNLMGFALRNQATPDLDGAQRHYDEALRLNPKHRGALEYSGHLALMKSDLPTAESRLAVLAQACPRGCEELDILKKSVAGFKANGVISY